MRSRCWTAGSRRKVSSLVPVRRQRTLACEGAPSDFLVFGSSAGPGAPAGTCLAARSDAESDGAGAPRRVCRVSGPRRRRATRSARRPLRLSQPLSSSPGVHHVAVCAPRRAASPTDPPAAGPAPPPFDHRKLLRPRACCERVRPGRRARTRLFYVGVSQCSPRMESGPTTWRRVHSGAAEGRWTNRTLTGGGVASTTQDPGPDQVHGTRRSGATRGFHDAPARS